jgi:hypothetical protein
MPISLYRALPVLVFALFVVSSSLSALAAPLRMGAFIGAHGGRPGMILFHPRPGGGFIGAQHFGEHFRNGRDRFYGGGDYGGYYGGDYGPYASYGYGGYGQYPTAGGVNVSQTNLRVVVNGAGDASMAEDAGLHGDCLFRKLIYSPDGRYLGQRTSRACY